MPDYRLLYDEARSQLDQQLAAIDAIDAKIGIFFATASALLALIAASVVIEVGYARTNSLGWLLVPASIAYAVVVVATYWTQWGEPWYIGADVVQLAGNHPPDADESRVNLVAARTLLDKFGANQRVLDRKVWAMRIALLATTVLAGLSVLSALAVLLLGAPAAGHSP